MKELYERIKRIAFEIDNNHEMFGEDGMSVIVGLANCNDGKVEVLTASGEMEGVLAMLGKTAKHIERALDNEETDTNLN